MARFSYNISFRLCLRLIEASPPPSLVSHSIIEAIELCTNSIGMLRVRSRLLTEVRNEPVHLKDIKKENNINSLSIDQEIECPSCHGIMALCSDFDSFCYLCGECNFILYFE